MLEEILKRLKNEYGEILKNNLVGIYIHGSIALNCFNPEESDVDFIVVVNDRLDNEVQNNLINILLEMKDIAPKKGFEMSVVLRKYCLDFEYPTPYELHFSNDWENKYFNMPDSVCNQDFKIDPDLAAHFTIIRCCGQVLCGMPINEVFGEVKKEYYIDSIHRDIANAKEEILNNPCYMILNLCRVLAYLKDDKILSKEQGGLWGLENLNGEYKDTIQNALDNYLNNVDIIENDKGKLEFAEDMLNEIGVYYISR